MKKTNWLADRESFRREWNATAKWNMKNRPDDEETHEYYDELKKPLYSYRETPSSEQEQQQPKKRIHIRHKHKRVCPEHAQKLKQRREQQPGDDETAEQDNNKNVEREEVTNRMIRQQPVTFTLNQKSDDLMKMGLAKPPQMLLPGLHIPHVVGAGMCRMLTGGMPAHNARHFERRPNRDHPDFSKCTVDVTASSKHDKKVLAKQSLLSTKRGTHSVNAQDVGGFGTATKMPPTSMNEASEYVYKNHPGAVYHSDQPSDDPLVLRQLHHSMKNRHRQWIPAVPKEVSTRAETERKVVKKVVESEEGDFSSDSSSSSSFSEQIPQNNATKHSLLLSTSSTKAHLPKSTLIPKTHHHHHHHHHHHQDQNGVDTTGHNKTSSKQKRHASQHHHHHDQPLQPMLLRIPVSKDAFRKKDEIKTHHESKHSVGGKVMMRGSKA